jgi:hypothetical protein
VTYGANSPQRLPGRQSESATRTYTPWVAGPESAGPQSGSEFQEYQQSRGIQDFPDLSSSASVGQHAASGAPRPAMEDRGKQVLGFLREHRLFCSLLGVATLVRLVAMAGYAPALWYPDSLEYVEHAVHMYPDPIRPDGYPFFLVLLGPLHSIALVTATQHAMGLAMGVAVYALLRHRYELRSWTATLASVPPLLSVYGIQIEHFVLSDTLFAFLITLAVAVMLWRPEPTLWTCVWVGLLLSAASIDRSQTLVLLIAFLIYLLTCSSRRIIGVMLLTAVFAAPLVGYAFWFDSQNASLQLTTSTGAFLYGRIATFADCSVIKPPADERWLCLPTPKSKRLDPTYYVWGTQSPLSKGPASEFSREVNSLATNFALRAIEAQPGAYLRTVWHSTSLAFRLEPGPTPEERSQSLYVFPPTPPSVLSLATGCGIPLCTQAVSHYNGGGADTRLGQPFAGWIRAYQRVVTLPGPVLGLIVLVGAVGVGLAWRRFGNPALLPWLVGVFTIVAPAATAEYDARYVVASVPAFCIAAALGLQDIGGASQAFTARWRLRSGLDSRAEAFPG